MAKFKSGERVHVEFYDRDTDTDIDSDGHVTGIDDKAGSIYIELFRDGGGEDQYFWENDGWWLPRSGDGKHTIRATIVSVEAKHKYEQERAKLLAKFETRSPRELAESCADMYLGLNGLVDLCEARQKAWGPQWAEHTALGVQEVLDLLGKIQKVVRDRTFKE